MEVGQRVRVRRLRDRTPQYVVDRLGKIGVIKGFRVVDGQGIGIIVEFEDSFSTWFFEDELDPSN
jgi:Protein of unknown function (DUF2862)